MDHNQPTETFEEAAAEQHFEFPPYKAADFFEVCKRHHSRDFIAIVKDILEVEAPLSEELFLRRIVWFFGREKVTSVVQRSYEQQMYGCQKCGIIRRGGFLYLDNKKDIQFRASGDIERDIKQIAPEELAAGMLEILKQNVTADKNGLYRSIAMQCGVSRVGKAINEYLDFALHTLEDSIVIDGDQVSLK
jgi:ribosomal protein L36